MSPRRRLWLQALAAGAAAGAGAPARAAAGAGAAAQPAAAAPADDDTIRRGRRLAFPRDHGAHLGARTEWWYATGWLGEAAAPSHGFQVTFFRSRTGLAQDLPGRLAPRHLLFAHAALTDVQAQRHRHDQRLVRWSGDAAAGAAAGAGSDDTRVWIGPWRFERERAGYRATLHATGWSLALLLAPTQALLLQGDAGYSRKGPLERQASHYYSQPQLAVTGRLTDSLGGPAGPAARRVGAEAGAREIAGRAWLDHEWSEEILSADAVGWDWIGLNLFDGSALTAFQLRRADGQTLWAGGSWRAPGAAPRAYAPQDLRFVAGRRWRSPGTGASYPVEWQIELPQGRYTVRSLLDAQELDERGATGTVYWEGLSELLDAGGRRVGLGYLEMTGYAGRLRL